MSILDLDKELDLEEYYTDKIVKFFRKNGPNGWGFSSYLTDPIVINTETLFKFYQLPNILAAPENYALYTFSHGSLYFLQIFEVGSAFREEWYRIRGSTFKKEWNIIQMTKELQCGSIEVFCNDMSYIL